MKATIKKRTGTECKKHDCRHYDKRAVLGEGVQYCRECKWAYPSQYTKK